MSLFTVKQLHRDENLPVQLYPSPMNPSLQVHVAPPGVLLQTARGLQPPLLIAQCFVSSTPPDAMTSVQYHFVHTHFGFISNINRDHRVVKLRPLGSCGKILFAVADG